MYYELLYKSTCVLDDLSSSDLDHILVNARSSNVSNGVTGMLIFYKKQFLQLLEGKKDSVEYIYKSKIEKNNMHTDLKVLDSGKTKKRSFEKWSMGFCSKIDLPTHSHENFNLSSISQLVDNLTILAKNAPLSHGVSEFIYTYHLMRKLT
jgi:hypothetical protein